MWMAELTFQFVMHGLRQCDSFADVVMFNDATGMYCMGGEL